MGSYRRPRVFDPLDLEIIDHVYEVAWAQLEAREPGRDATRDDERRTALRKRLFILARSGPVDFDTLCDKVMATMPEPWAIPKTPRRSPKVGA
jgi:hypothetical protein